MPHSPVPSSRLAAAIRFALCAAFALSAVGCGEDETAATGDLGDAGDSGDSGDALPDSDGGDEPDAVVGTCGEEVLAATRVAADVIGERLAACITDGGDECAPDDEAIAAAMTAFDAVVAERCRADDVTAFLPEDVALSAEAWRGRIAEETLQGLRGLARFVFGGPRGRLYADSDTDEAACLEGVFGELSDFYGLVLDETVSCLTADDCDAEAVSTEIEARFDETADRIDAICGRDLDDLANTEASLVRLAWQQADCAAAAIVSAPRDLPVHCGPSNPLVEPLGEAGAWVAVTLPTEDWGTRCGDGSPYRFWVRLGTEPDKLFVDLAGGGVCLDEVACRDAAESGLLTAEDDLEAEPDGPWTPTDASNPFGTWTHVFLPYCTQDVFGGGGGLETLNEDEGNPRFEVYRYGGRDVRAALRYVRDALWRYHDIETEGGYRAAALTVLLSGTSAGGFGTYLNHHYLLDGLHWPHTYANPRVWLSLSAPEQPIEGLFVLKLLPWLLRDSVPSYCNVPQCGTGRGFLARHAARLDDDSLFLVASTEVDRTQANTTFHESIFAWANRARTMYCAVQGTENVHFFLRANTAPIDALIADDELTPANSGHNVLPDDEVGGVAFDDWLAAALDDPSSAEDLVEEGTLVELSQDASLTELPGYEAIAPFECLEE